MKNKLILASIVTLSLTFATASHAIGYTSGNVCTPAVALGQPLTVVSTDPYGAANPTTSDLLVNCPLSNNNFDVRRFSIQAYDRNLLGKVQCSVSGWDGSGNFVGRWSVATTTDGTPSGGSIGGPGDGTQYTKSVSIPANSGLIWTAQCNIPGATVQNGVTWVSHIVGFLLLAN